MIQTIVDVGKLCRVIQDKYEEFPRMTGLALNVNDMISLEKIQEMIEYHSSVQTLLEQLHRHTETVMTMIPTQPQLLQLLDQPLPPPPIIQYNFKISF